MVTAAFGMFQYCMKALSGIRAHKTSPARRYKLGILKVKSYKQTLFPFPKSK